MILHWLRQRIAAQLSFNHQLAISLLIGTGMAIALLHPLVNASFVIPDDHYPLSLYISGQKDFASVIDKTWMLASQNFGTARFQPSYYFMKAAEMWITGGSAQGQHVLHIAYFAIFLGGAIMLMSQSLGFLLASSIVLLATTAQWWIDIFARSLGPSEIYAAGALGLISYAFSVIINESSSRRGINMASVILTLGCLVGIAQKESFISLAGLALLFAVVCIRRGVIVLPVIGAILSAGYSIIICISAIMGPISSGIDVYGKPVVLSTKLLAIWSNPIVWAAPICAVVIWEWARYRPVRRMNYLFPLALIWLWLLWERFFYGDPYFSLRYRFPMGLLEFAPFVVVASFFMNGVKDRMLKWVIGTQAAVIIFICAVLSGFPLTRGAYTLNQSSNMFLTDSLRLKKIAAEHPDWPVIFEIDAQREYEPATGYPIFYRWHDIRNKYFLRVRNLPEQDTAAATDLKANSKLGQRGYSPWSEYDDKAEMKGHCISVTFVAPIKTPCIAISIRGTWTRPWWRDEAKAKAKAKKA